MVDDNKGMMIGDAEDTSHISVVAALIAIGDSPVADIEIHKHIVRAFDNLSTAGSSLEYWVTVLKKFIY